MTPPANNDHTRPAWFVGAAYGSNDDQTERFLQDGIWENGWDDGTFNDRVEAVQPGDRIAIKSFFTQRNRPGPPFDARGHSVSGMVIKATGIVAANMGDGRHLKVDWTRVNPPREWYFSTYMQTIHAVTPGEWKTDALIAFTFDNQPQDIERFRNDPQYRERFGDVAETGQRPVWFVTGGPRWRGHVYPRTDRPGWICPSHHYGHGDDEHIHDMGVGDWIVLKGGNLNAAGGIGIWAIGRVEQNNHPAMPWVLVEWVRKAQNEERAVPLMNLPLTGLELNADDCIWRLTRDTDAGRAFIAEALGESIDADPEPTLQSSTDTIADIIADGCFVEPALLETMHQRLHAKRNLILQGPPGTGKTWLAKRLAYALVGSKDDNRVRPLQFHPNMSYEDFVRGWRPSGDGRLELVDGPFLRLINDARQDPDAPYVMVIEEINRGSPAQIFGEMLTLLESDKRYPGEALALAHPDPGVPDERVYIPPNVYVIGTMNVADRSLALVDFALRRRFAFFDLEPIFGAVWRNWVSANCGIPAAFLSAVERKLTELNDQIAADPTLGKQFRIGHSVVTPAPGAPIDHPEEWFRQVVATEIAPLLDEYWFDSPNTADAAKSKLLDLR